MHSSHLRVHFVDLKSSESLYIIIIMNSNSKEIIFQLLTNCALCKRALPSSFNVRWINNDWLALKMGLGSWNREFRLGSTSDPMEWENILKLMMHFPHVPFCVFIFMQIMTKAKAYRILKPFKV